MLPIGEEWPGNLLNSFTIWLKSLKARLIFISLNHCHDCDNDAQVEHISLPALYRLVCREMGAGCKVKVLKMSAQVSRLGFTGSIGFEICGGRSGNCDSSLVLNPIYLQATCKQFIANLDLS